MDELIAVAKGEDYLEIHPTTLKAHKAVGWKECAKREAELPPDNAKLTALKAKADALGVGYAADVNSDELANKLAEFEASKNPSDGLTVAEIKEALAAKNIAIPDGVTLKADLAKLLDEAPAA